MIDSTKSFLHDDYNKIMEDIKQKINTYIRIIRNIKLISIKYYFMNFHTISCETELQLAKLLEIFNGVDNESMQLGISLFLELFPDDSFFEYLRDFTNKSTSYISKYEINSFLYLQFVPKYTMQSIILALLVSKKYYTF